MGVGRASGKNRAEEALRKAIENPLLETSIDGAKAVLINLCGDNVNMQEMGNVSDAVYDSVDVDAQIIIGTLNSEDMNDEIQVTVIAAGFDEEAIGQEAAPADNVRGGRAGEQARPSEASNVSGASDDLDIPFFLRGKH